MRNRTQPPLIVHDMLSTPGEANTNTWKLQPRLLKLFGGDVSEDSMMGPARNKKKEKKEKKKKTKEAKTFNVFESEPDFESPNGRSITINRNDLKVLKGSMVGVSMVNLTQGSMMGPHWNPWACEISVVLKGSGMVRVLRSSISRSASECKNTRFRVEEGDIFAIPRLHPMAQMSFISESLVFIGFTTSAKNNEPQFLAGRSSALRFLDREVLAASLNVSSVMIDGLLGAQKESVMLGCPLCAEGELEKLEVETETKKRDDERKREEEEAEKEEEQRRKREEEEEKKRWPPQPQPQQPPQPFQPRPPQPSVEPKRRDDERKREQEEAMKEEEERWKQEEGDVKKW